MFYQNKTGVVDSNLVNYTTSIEELNFYDNGNRKSFLTFYQGYGMYYSINWRPDGNIESTGLYGFDSISNNKFESRNNPLHLTDRGMKNGKWVYYDDSGKVTKTEIWDNGILIQTK